MCVWVFFELNERKSNANQIILSPIIHSINTMPYIKMKQRMVDAK